MAEVPGLGNRLEQPIYDTIQLAVAATRGTFFTVPVGGVFFGTTAKTFAETNLVQAGRLERGVQLVIDGISLYHPRETTAATAANISAVHRGRFRMTLGQVEFLNVPIALIPNGGAELVMFSNIVAAATEFRENRGISAISNRFPLRHPITLNEQESIQVDIDNMVAIAAAVVNITCVLWGSYTRPVR